jgi:hypothetical protein
MISVPAIGAVGKALTVNVLVATAVQPAAFVTVTVYVPVVLTVMAAVVAVVLHKYVPPPLAVKVVLSPEQMELLPLIKAVGKLFTTIVPVAFTDPHPPVSGIV